MLCDNPFLATTAQAPESAVSITLLQTGMLFRSFDDLDDYVRTYAIMVHCGYRVTQTHSGRVGRECLKKTSDNCQWKLWASRIPGGFFEIKTYAGDHTCTGDDGPSSPQMSAQWIARRIFHKIVENPEYKPGQIARDIHHAYHVSIRYGLAHSARQAALAAISGGKELAYMDLPRYAKMIEKTNPGSLACVETDETQKFARFFVSYKCHAAAFQWCRPLIFLDAGFIKEEFGGQVFVASTIDANGQLLPLALAIARSESEDSWKWILQLLQRQLERHSGNNEESQLTIISDRAKGLINAVEIVFPTAHHAFCLRHLCANLQRNFAGKIDLDVLTSIFWETATAKTEHNYQASLKKLDAELPAAVKYLEDLGTKHWAAAHFQGMRYGHTTSNPAESINAWLESARHLPILKLLETVRQRMAKWMYDRRLAAEGTAFNRLPTTPDEIVQLATDSARQFQVNPTSRTVFEVIDSGKSHTIDLSAYTCSCTIWQEFQLPCKHAAAAILHYGKNTELQSSRPRDWAHRYYTAESYMQTYKIGIVPIPEAEFWDVTASDEETVLPPARKISKGRKKVKRYASQMGDGPSQQKRIVCSYCENYSPPYHNRKSCPVLRRVEIEDRRQDAQDIQQGTIALSAQPIAQIAPAQHSLRSTTERTSRQVAFEQAAARGRVGSHSGTISSHQVVDGELWFWITWDDITVGEENPTPQLVSNLRQNGAIEWVLRYCRLHWL